MPAANGLAAQTPRPGGGDSRIRVVRYDPTEVVQLSGYYGYALTVEFGRNERIESAALGDSGAWLAEPRRNILFLKPSGEKANTNLVVTTDRRVYYFDLRAQRGRPSIYAVRFDYPRTGADNDPAVADGVGRKTAPTGRSDWGYSYSGSPELAPASAYDDGRFTFLRFAPGQTLPAIYKVEADGSESLVNYHVQEPWVIVEETAAQLVLRRGDTVTCVFSDRRMGSGPTLEPPAKADVRPSAKRGR